jgi:mRNA interferase MazF
LVISQGDVWWADLPDPIGSEAGYRRPVVIVQSDSFNQSLLATAVCVPLTGNLRAAGAPGNVRLSARTTGLPKDSVANAAQIFALNRTRLTECVGRLPQTQLKLVLAGIDVVLGR